MTDEAVQTPARPSRRWFGWGLAAVFALFLGGCVVVLASVDPTSSRADRSDYLLTLDVCRVDEFGPFASGTIRNSSDDARIFQVQVTIFDAETAELVASRAVPVLVEPGETKPYEMYIIDFRKPPGGSLPDSVVCVESVFDY